MKLINMNLIAALFLTLLAAACSNTTTTSATNDSEPSESMASSKPKEKKEITISGEIEGGAGQNLILQYLKVQSADNLDTTTIAEDGSYEFRFLPPADGFYRVMLTDQNLFVVVVRDNKNIVVDAEASNMYQSYEVKKSEPTQLLKDLNKILGVRDSIGMVMQTAQMNNDQALFSEVIAVYEPTLEKVNLDIKKFIDENTQTYAALAALQNLNPDADFEYYAKVISELEGIADENDYYAALSKEVNAMKKFAPGSPAPNFTLPTPEGESMSLSDLKGQYVLIDFWASWCGPCRRENPNVKRVYDKYHSKGFEILGVSLDKNRNAWLAAIKQDGLEWPHVSDLKYWNSAVVPMYQITGIPLTVLVDPEGNIVAKNLRGPALETKLAQIFGG